MVNSKQKGAGFERNTCVRLSRWLTDGKREDVLWRSAMSGGRATVRGKRGKNTNAQLGDISSIAPEGHWLTDKVVIEIKFYADLDITACLLMQRGKLYKFWLDVCTIARDAGKQPLLIAKQNRMDTLFVTTPKCAGMLGVQTAVMLETKGTFYRTPHIGFLDDFVKVKCIRNE